MLAFDVDYRNETLSLASDLGFPSLLAQGESHAGATSILPAWNPPAGLLVEQSGAQELVRGDAVVSERHGNFIVNRGKARAADVFELMQAVRAQVLDATGVELEYEVRRWTDDRDPGGSRST